jgi:putative salt-induced outer membrane protein YdiY
MNRSQDTGVLRRLASVTLAFVMFGGAAFAEDEEEKEEGWTGEIAASVNAQTGSTDTFAGSLDARTEKVFHEKDLLRFRFSGVYGTTRSRDNDVNTETISNSQMVSSTWKRSFSGRFFWLTTPSLARDSTQDLDLRAIFATGPGYRLWQGEDGESTHFDIAVGPGYRYEIYDGNTGGTVSENGDTDHFADLVASFEYMNMLFDDKVEYRHTGSVRMPANDTASYLLRSEVVFGVPITASWSFRTGFVVEYVAEPGSDEVNNTTTRTNVGLEYKF